MDDAAVDAMYRAERLADEEEWQERLEREHTCGDCVYGDDCDEEGNKLEDCIWCIVMRDLIQPGVRACDMECGRFECKASRCNG